MVSRLYIELGYKAHTNAKAELIRVQTFIKEIKKFLYQQFLLGGTMT